jgi:hypothetical protein
MNSHRAIVAAACLALFGIGPAAGQAVFTEVSGIEVLALPGVPPPAGFPSLPLPVEGTVNCQGQAIPTGDLRSPCGPGVGAQVRGRVIWAYEIASPLFGVSRIVANMNLDGNGEGPIWGTFDLMLLGGNGVFEGTYGGKANVTNSVMTLDIVGHGHGGAVDGMQLKVRDVHPFPPIVPNPDNVSVVGTLDGRMLDPGGRH